MPISTSSASVRTGTSSAQSSHDSGPSSVPFRASSAVKARSRKPATTASSSSDETARYSTWLLLDTDDDAAPFLRTLMHDGSTSPTNRSAEKLTESTNTRNEDKRYSLQPQQPQSKRGFMSRLRNAGGSVSGANHFAPTQQNGLSTSGSWAMVDPPAIRERGERRSVVHIAFSSQATEAAMKRSQGLVSRCSLPSPEAVMVEERVHPTRLDTAGLQGLVELVRPDAVYIGSARTTSPSTTSTEQLHSLISSLIATPSTIKHILAEPRVARSLNPAHAASLFDLAASIPKPMLLSLPTRWSSLLSTTQEETLLGLELLHELSCEQTVPISNGLGGDEDRDTSEVEKSFDVSMSNIPTGMSGEGLDSGAGELERMRKEMERLKEELEQKDRRIVELVVAGQAAKLQPPSEPLPTTPAIQEVTAVAPIAPPPAAATPPRNLTSSAGVALQPALPITSPSSSPTQSRSTTKAIASLTSELVEMRSVLSATLSALATVRMQSVAHQAAAEEMRSTLSRARLENDSSITILARKDRQIIEALERARKAEAEAKELGRAGREWGTRVREVEEQLGKERIRCARAEQSYDTLSSEWKLTRERLMSEVQLLKSTHKDKLNQLQQEYNNIRQLKDKLLQDSSQDPQDPKSLLSAIRSENANMQSWITNQIHPLLTQLKQVEEREDTQVTSKIKLLTDELTRIKTLMRRGDVVGPSQVPPSTL